MLKTLAPGAIGINGLSLAETIDLAKETGYEAVSFDIREAAAIAERDGFAALNALFTEAGIAPAMWSLPVGWRGDTWREGLKELPDFARLGVELGCPRALSGIWPGSDELTYAQNWEKTVQRLRPVARVLNDAGCVLGLEFIGPKTLRAPHTHEFIYRMDQTLELAAKIGTGNVGVLLDAWHLYASGGTIDEVRALRAEDVVAVHVNDAPVGLALDELQDLEREMPLATGVIDLGGFMQALVEIGFDGPVMVEPFNAALNALAADDPAAAATEARVALDRLWELVGA